MLLPAGPAVGDEAKRTYGNTPEELRPFRRFVKQPYKEFFTYPPAYLGPGREMADPDVDSVKIGVLAPLSRSHETYIGRPLLNGVLLAVEEANRKGGYKGKPFKPVVRNDTGLWGASANEIVSFSYVDSVWAVVGTVDGANTHIAIRVALKTDLPVMNVADTDPTLVETKIPWIFRNIADDRQMAYTIAYHVYRERGFGRVAILRADNRYGRLGVGEFRAGSIRMRTPPPMEINYEIGHANLNPDFGLQMDRLKQVKPDAVVLWADAEAGGHLVRRMREEGIDVPVFACDRILAPRFLSAAGAAAEGVVATVPYNPEADLRVLKAFNAAYDERFATEPSVYAAHAYDGARMVIDAIRKAGLNRYRIRDELARMTRYEGVTGKIVMDDAYSDRGTVTLATVKDGRWVYDEPKVARSF